ncbi:hypothetical protein N783_01250 [Pontibacillus marinus BH030004 = DSM 16465]|uniref:Lipoprotein n=2 Tax=Pontibacillus TaxID=289201 RepID=A0A0A5GAE8_9BACI|nr:hypothetical protein N783_01250 [Pontibacillus marinus BH030004 = DSM 16465]
MIIPNKKVILLLFILSLFLVACGNKSLSGESENWIGRYSGSEENKERVREFVIRPKDNKEVSVPVSYKIISERNDLDLKGTKHLEANSLDILTRCSDCNIALKGNEISIELKWNGKKETLVLTN